MASGIRVTGVIHGKTIILDEATFLADGCPVVVHITMTREEALRQLALPGEDMTPEEVAELEEVLSELRGRPVELPKDHEVLGEETP